MNYNVTGYDVAPDLSKYEHAPYPPLKDESGNDLDVNAVRGTRLFGYEDCGPQEYKIINDAYNDFYKLSHLDGLYANFAWDNQPAQEIWGKGIPDGTKEEIRRTFYVSPERQHR